MLSLKVGPFICVFFYFKIKSEAILIFFDYPKLKIWIHLNGDTLHLLLREHFKFSLYFVRKENPKTKNPGPKYSIEENS